MSKSITRIFILAKRNIKEIVRDPLSLIFMLAMPLGMEVLFYCIFHELADQFSMRTLAPGIVVFAQAFLTLFTGLLISLDRESAFLTRLYVSRTRSFEFILGYALAVIPLSLIQSVIFFTVGGIIEPALFGAGMILAALTSVVTGLFFIATGILLGSLCNEKAIGGVASIVIAGQSMLSGMWFPTEGLPSGFIRAMNCLPFRNATTLVQNVQNGITDMTHDFLIPLLIVCAYTLGALILAVWAFGSRMKEK